MNISQHLNRPLVVTACVCAALWTPVATAQDGSAVGLVKTIKGTATVTSVITPAGMIGVRGTPFLLKDEEA